MVGLAACAEPKTPDTIAKCEGLACEVVECSAQNLPPTTVSGTVYAPNGTLPLAGVTVYVPVRDPGPLPDGVTCGQCADDLPGGALTRTVTDAYGHFSLANLPATGDVPLVLQVGKWRRQLVVPAVTACEDTELPAAATRLPRNHSEGDVPRIAITTGDADALECLVRKLGVDDREITSDAGGGRVHLYDGNGANRFADDFAGGRGAFSPAESLWGQPAKLARYDVVMFSCEGAQHPETKPQAALEAVHDYADQGGRVFLSHWHNFWMAGEQDHPEHGLADWREIATFDLAARQDDRTQRAVIDDRSPKGQQLATWLQHVGGSRVPGQLEVTDPRYTCQAVDPDKAQALVSVDPASGKTGVQDLQFTTPQQIPEADRCGKVVFSDMHVSAGSTSKAAVPFPGGCSADDLTAQEKALAFLFFDINACVGALL